VCVFVCVCVRVCVCACVCVCVCVCVLHTTDKPIQHTQPESVAGCNCANHTLPAICAQHKHKAGHTSIQQAKMVQTTDRQGWPEPCTLTICDRAHRKLTYWKYRMYKLDNVCMHGCGQPSTQGHGARLCTRAKKNEYAHVYVF